MFTTEHWTRLRETSAPHVRFLLVLGALFAATLLGSAKFLDVWTAQTNHRVQAVAALDDQTRVLAVGSSHVFATINPALARWPTMNLAAPVCSYVCMEGIVAGNLHKVPRLQVLVLEYGVVPMFYDTLRAYHGDYRQLLELDPDIGAMDISNWQKYELWRDSWLERSVFGPLFRFGKLTPEEVLARVRGERHLEDSVVGPGFANGPEVMPPDDDGPARVARHVRETPGMSELGRNEAALRRLIRLATSKHLKLVLMRFPHHPGYFAALPPEWRASEADLLARLQRDFPNAFVYWDFGELPFLSDRDYRNGDHINEGATARVTALYAARLATLLGEPALAGEPAATENVAHDGQP